MKYYLKLTDEALEKIREQLGIEMGFLNLKKGTIVINGRQRVRKIAENYGIEKINNIPYDKVEDDGFSCVKKAKKITVEPLPEGGELTLGERTAIIGDQIVVGSIVIFKQGKETNHLVITNVDGDSYDAMRIILGYKFDDGLILLRKVEDVIFRNVKYPINNAVTSEKFVGLKKSDFDNKSGGLILGKVTNESILQKILDLSKSSEVVEILCNHEDESENDLTDADSSVYGEENTSEEEQDFEEAMKESEEQQEVLVDDKKISFEEILSEVVNVDELFSRLNISEVHLKHVVSYVVLQKKANMKQIISYLQKENPEGFYSKLSQNAIKNIISESFKSWYDTESVAMEEYSLVYFLKKIVKKFK